MNKIVSKFLLAGDNFMSQFHSRQLGFTYSACGPSTKHCEKIQKFRETGNLKRIYKNELDKVCFLHNGTYSDSSKDLAKSTVSDKILKDRAYEIVINPKLLSPRHLNTGLVSSGVSFTSWGEGTSLSLVDHPSSDGITIKIPYGVRCFITSTSLALIFSYWVG